jgi:hypothetical protein
MPKPFLIDLHSPVKVLVFLRMLNDAFIAAEQTRRVGIDISAHGDPFETGEPLLPLARKQKEAVGFCS